MKKPKANLQLISMIHILNDYTLGEEVQYVEFTKTICH